MTLTLPYIQLNQVIKFTFSFFLTRYFGKPLNEKIMEWGVIVVKLHNFQRPV